MKCQWFQSHSNFFLKELEISVMTVPENPDVTAPLIETEHIAID